ncbi:MAG TPA: formate dehydrogenase [Pseudolabrys sp.]|nr:formate dehydrogenase [Pseudolabrys sp.]
MTMHQDKKGNERPPKVAQTIDRRLLLTGAGLAIGAAGATAVSTVAPAAAADEPKKRAHNGYRESEEVKTYYRLARF